jgi:hypothetical protein
MSTLRTVVVWWGITVALLAAVGVTWDACTRWQQRRDVTRFQQARLERQERYAAASMAAAMTAARRRHPTSRPSWRQVQAMPADQYDRLMHDAEIIRLFKAEIAQLRGGDE